MPTAMMKNENARPSAQKFPPMNIAPAWNQNICIAPIEAYTDREHRWKAKYQSLYLVTGGSLYNIRNVIRGFHIDNLSNIYILKEIMYERQESRMAYRRCDSYRLRCEWADSIPEVA